jgi:hypothetical protein
MRDAGASPHRVSRAAAADGWDFIRRIRIVRDVFSLSLTEGKEVVIVSDGTAASLDDYQERMLPALRAAFDDTDSP